MPVMPLVRVRDAAEAIAAAVRVEHGFHHTATMHSRNIDNMAAMARVCNCSIFVKNDVQLPASGSAARATPRSRSRARPARG